jgi:subfamily B ATP-binding cassette protein MsbA
MRPAETPDHAPGNLELLRWIATTQVRRHAAKLALAGLCMAVTAAAAAGMAWLAQPIMDEAIQGTDPTTLYLVALALFGVMTANGLAIYGHKVLLAAVSERIVADLQISIFQKYMEADLAYLNDHHSGQLISRCLNDTSQISDMVSVVVLSLARDTMMFLLLAGVMFYRDWQLALVTFIVLPLVGLGIGRIGRLARQASTAVLTESAKVTTILSEALGGVRLVKAYGGEPHEIERAREAIDRKREWGVRLARAQAMVSPLTEFLGGAAIAMTILYGVWRFEAGEFTIGTLTSFLAALALCYRPLKSLAHVNVRLQRGLAALRRIREILDTQPRLTDVAGAKPLRDPRGEIRFENVTFAYATGGPIIRDVSVVIPSGRSVALVGPSGAGKSTLVNLIPRLYDVVSGGVLVDGTDLRDVTLASLRDAIALVTQETILFDDTVRANIAYGCRDATEAEIAAAARAALAEDFIARLPQGFDTIIGERGHRLSGGQRQRIAIARAMLKNAPILLLDEPTSSLDNESERLVKLALGHLIRGRTTLIVAHRLSTVMDADEIHVMDHGRIVESGRHRELLERGGMYARLYALQSATETDEAAVPPTTAPFAAVPGAGQD